MKNKLKKNISATLLGGLAGLINGLFGGGGGMVVVPTLTDLIGRERKKAQATAMLVILPLSLISAFLYSSFGYCDPNTLIPTMIGTAVGGITGALFLRKTSDVILFFLFYTLMFFAGLKMIF
ncbi:MAG: sulfite exporter TauE/SafE family protein [Clostridia bacterium]|nr:sulfite exporter TauE/SafE family protein [Clostridia bacterium]